MCRLIVAGIGTEVGKTVASAILTTALQGDYWKPIECGEKKDSDTCKMKHLISQENSRIYPSAYSFEAPLSPHHAARLENRRIDIKKIHPPSTQRPLIIESVGGIFVPLTETCLTFDLFKKWDSRWILVSKHYLGSINHTLLTIEALKRHRISLIGLIFNGEPNADSEAAILNIAQVCCIGRIFPEKEINKSVIQRYAKQWSIPAL